MSHVAKFSPQIIGEVPTMINVADHGATGDGLTHDGPAIRSAIAAAVAAGYGSPLNVVTAPICARYFRVDGGANTTLYVKESGTGASTGWVAK